MTTETQPPAQASDEPMRAALMKARAQIVKNRPALTLSRNSTIADYFSLLAQIDAALGSTPRATADVELDVSYELVQDDMIVAGTSGSGAEREIQHYAMVYGQDGPCEIYRVTREKVAVSKPGEPNGSA